MLYYLPGGDFSVKYGCDSMIDFYVQCDKSIFNESHLSKSVLFLRRNKYVYFLMMFPIKGDTKLPKKLLSSLVS